MWQVWQKTFFQRYKKDFTEEFQNWQKGTWSKSIFGSNIEELLSSFLCHSALRHSILRRTCMWPLTSPPPRFNYREDFEAARSRSERNRVMPSLFYPYLLLCICGLGVVSNVGSLFVFAKQRFRRNFHRLLVTLAVYDFMVKTFASIKVD